LLLPLNEFLLLVLPIDFAGSTGCAKVSASESPSSGEAWPRFCMSALLSSTTQCVAKYTLSRPHPDPSPVSGN
jgi:hypothetical protein